MSHRPKRRRWDLAAPTTNQDVAIQATEQPPALAQTLPAQPTAPPQLSLPIPASQPTDTATNATLEAVKQRAAQLAARFSQQQQQEQTKHTAAISTSPFPGAIQTTNPANTTTTTTTPSILQQQTQTTDAARSHQYHIDVSINDVASQIRANLTKLQYLAAVSQRWKGVGITVKGKYYPPGTPKPSGSSVANEAEKPILLRITPPTTIKVGLKLLTFLYCIILCTSIPDRAMNTISSNIQDAKAREEACRGAAEELLSYINTNSPEKQQQQISLPPPPQQPKTLERCLYFGAFDLPPEFNAAQRLTGPNNSYLDHITASTGVGCELIGKTVGVVWQPHEQPLHIRLTITDTINNSSIVDALEIPPQQQQQQQEENQQKLAGKKIDIEEALRKATGLATDLIDTIREEYRKAYPTLPHPAAGQYGPPARMTASVSTVVDAVNIVPFNSSIAGGGGGGGGGVGLPRFRQGHGQEQVQVPGQQQSYNAVPPPGVAAVGGGVATGAYSAMPPPIPISAAAVAAGGGFFHNSHNDNTSTSVGAMITRAAAPLTSNTHDRVHQRQLDSGELQAQQQRVAQKQDNTKTSAAVGALQGANVIQVVTLLVHNALI